MAFDVAKCMIRTPEQTREDIESVNRCLNPLSLVSTTDLVAELCSREGVSMPFTIGEMYSVTINHEIEFMDPYEVCGPAKIIVVRGE